MDSDEDGDAPPRATAAAYPGGQPNPSFAAQLAQQIDVEALTMFLCRSGGRSHAAAATAKQAGYTARCKR